MTLAEVRQKYLDFFKKRGHVEIPSSSLVPTEEVTITDKTLFTSAGMQPLIPYLLGEPHPSGNRLISVQKCLRTGDIEEVGDRTHLTFFEMLGNWSLGDYFKNDAIKWSYELLTNNNDKPDGDKGFGLDLKRLYVTVFEGDENAPRDDESADIWQKQGVPKNRIYYMPAEKNWWEAGPNGPCGPDTEMYYDLTEDGLGDLTHEQFIEADNNQKIVEIWNDVFMEYLKKDGRVVGKLPQKNVDTGAGLERIATVLQKRGSVFETDELSKVFIVTASMNDAHEKQRRIITDHIRSAVFMIADGVMPSNMDKGYIVRRLIRRAVFSTSTRALSPNEVSALVKIVVDVYGSRYDNLQRRESEIVRAIQEEVEQFEKTLVQGLREFEKFAGGDITGKEAFLLFSSYGFPIDMTVDLAKEREITVDVDGFNIEFDNHRVVSRAGADKKFKGGLSDTSEMSLKYHTATHLLHQALRDVLGDEVRQKGSNITPERLRFDFAFSRKMTDQEKSSVEEIVNTKIGEKLPVQKVVLPFAEAEKTGALHFFGEKYGDEVSVYFIGKDIESAYSKEFCGGPHVENIGVLGEFKISKEEAVSAGVRRIKAVLDK